MASADRHAAPRPARGTVVAAAVAAGALLRLAAPEAAAALPGAAPSLPLAAALGAAAGAAAAAVRLEVMHRAFRNGRVLLLAFLVDWVAAPALLLGFALFALRGRPELLAGAACLAALRAVTAGTADEIEAGADRDFADGLAAYRAVFLSLFAAIVAFALAAALTESLAPAPPVAFKPFVAALLLGAQLPLAAGLLLRFAARRGGRLGAVEGRAALLRGATTAAAAAAAFLAAAAIPAPDLLESLARFAAAIALHAAVVFTASIFLAHDFSTDYERACAIAVAGARTDGPLALAAAAGFFGLGHPAALAGVAALLLDPILSALLVRHAPRHRRRFGLPR